MTRGMQLGTIGLLVLALGFGGWMWRDNRRLRDELGRRTPAVAAKDSWADSAPPAPTTTSSERSGFSLPALGRRLTGGPLPKVEGAPAETRAERRLRRQNEMAALLGRDPDESEADYKARILPLMELALGGRRKDLADARRAAEDQAGVTDAQRTEIDAAFAGIYDEVVAFTDTAVADGQLTPYERNVKGLLQYAGGLGSILEGAEGRVGGILSPEQQQIIYQSGFEWGEYLGVNAPWERLRAPPVRPN